MTKRRYEFRSASGKVCCSTDNPVNLCNACRRKLTTSALIKTTPPVVKKTLGEWQDYYGRKLRGYGSVVVTAAPDPYAAGLARLRKEKR